MSLITTIKTIVDSSGRTIKRLLSDGTEYYYIYDDIANTVTIIDIDSSNKDIVKVVPNTSANTIDTDSLSCKNCDNKPVCKYAYKYNNPNAEIIQMKCKHHKIKL